MSVSDFSKGLDWLYLKDLFQLNRLHTAEWDAENKYEGSSHHVLHTDYPSISLRKQKRRNLSKNSQYLTQDSNPVITNKKQDY
jgi:hypothetical protein